MLSAAVHPKGCGRSFWRIMLPLGNGFCSRLNTLRLSDGSGNPQ